MPTKPANQQVPGPEDESKPIPPSIMQKLMPVLALLLLVVAGAAGWLAYNSNQKLQDLKNNPQKAAQAETQELLSKVASLIVLPTDEQPTIATVADPEKLKGQQFFANAHVGDKVLIYTNARKAILYDPVAHKIIEVAPVNIGSQTAGVTTTAPEESE